MSQLTEGYADLHHDILRAGVSEEPGDKAGLRSRMSAVHKILNYEPEFLQQVLVVFYTAVSSSLYTYSGLWKSGGSFGF